MRNLLSKIVSKIIGADLEGELQEELTVKCVAINLYT